jgi:hypothetical protein
MTALRRILGPIGLYSRISAPQAPTVLAGLLTIFVRMHMADDQNNNPAFFFIDRIQ